MRATSAPRSPSPAACLAANLRMLGDHSAAQALIDDALARYPDDLMALTEAARLASDRNRPNDAAAFWLRAIKRARPHADWLQGYGQSLFFAGDVERATRVLASARRQHPRHRGLIAAEGAIAVACQDWRKAIAFWTEYRRRFPDDATGWEQLGIAVQGARMGEAGGRAGARAGTGRHRRPRRRADAPPRHGLRKPRRQLRDGPGATTVWRRTTRSPALERRQPRQSDRRPRQQLRRHGRVRQYDNDDGGKRGAVRQGSPLVARHAHVFARGPRRRRRRLQEDVPPHRLSARQAHRGSRSGGEDLRLSLADDRRRRASAPASPRCARTAR